MARRFLLPLLAALPCVDAQTVDTAFFETKIRPVLAGKCYACHSSKLKAPMAGLVLDTKAGTRKGGVLGPAVVPGKPAEGHLLRAIGYRDSRIQMPPTGKLPDEVVADFRRWIEAGAPDPRQDEASQGVAALKGMPIAEGRRWWAFQPVVERARPKVAGAPWPKTKIDYFVLEKLEAKRIAPSAPADPRTLVRRAYVDLVGYKPSYDEVERFANSPQPAAYSELIDTLLASPHYGERWGRHWLDVARFAEDNPTSEATNPPYPFAWRYRDWVIEALNEDLPYDRFVKLQLAADQLPDAPRSDMRALGYLGTAPIYHKDQRLSAEVIGGFMTDDWDDRVDAVSRGILGLTVACARCHDHKFDPITTKDYYGLVGVFASTMRAERPLFDVDAETEARYLWVQRRLFDLRYSINLLTGEASTVVNSAALVAKWKPELEALEKEWKANQERHPKLVKSLEKHWTFSKEPQPRVRNRTATSAEPFMNAVYDAAQYVDGSESAYTFVNYRPGEARDHPVLLSGNVATPGPLVPRKFLGVLSRDDSQFRKGSGRAELAYKIFNDAAPLAARVIVNRVWHWHFGRPLVPTASDFGTQGERPSHPELLDDLAARFIANGWSLKWLHREIMLSAAYRQASAPRKDAQALDQANALLWRMNPRRLDVESYRDTLLRISGLLDTSLYGPSEDVDAEGSVRRTVYGRVSRSRLSKLLQLYDFPDATQTSPGRDLTTSALQSLFVLNSEFMKTAATAASRGVSTDAVRDLFRRILARDPSPRDLDAALTYLGGRDLENYARILMSTNEVIFWP